MDSLPREVLMRVHEYAAPSAPPQHAAGIRLCTVRRHMREVSNMRRVNRHWRNALDDPKALVWYRAAKEMSLEPPLQLYSGGTYREACQLLLEAECKKQEATDQAARSSPLYIACGMRSRSIQLDEHPNPERPAVSLPKELVERVAANAKALETFLRSMDFGVLMSHKRHESWHESALNRYRMFLHLKRANPSVWLVPTAEIEFCWLAHIFRTGAYWKDMTELDIEPDHWLCLSYGEVATFSKAVQATQRLWNDTFGPKFPYLAPGTDTSWEVWRIEQNFRYREAKVCRQDPRRFFPSMGPEILSAPGDVALPSIHLTAADIEADLKWFPELQSAFEEMWRNSHNVMRGRDPYREKLIAQQVLPSYERFLNLCHQQNVDFSPPYVLDLVWHAHQMEPHLYKKDCLALFGREFWHEPWPHGLGVSSPLTKDFECAWKQAYGTPVGEDWKFYLGNEERTRGALQNP